MILPKPVQQIRKIYNGLIYIDVHTLSRGLGENLKEILGLFLILINGQNVLILFRLIRLNYLLYQKENPKLKLLMKYLLMELK